MGPGGINDLGGGPKLSRGTEAPGGIGPSGRAEGPGGLECPGGTEDPGGAGPPGGTEDPGRARNREVLRVPEEVKNSKGPGGAEGA